MRMIEKAVRRRQTYETSSKAETEPRTQRLATHLTPYYTSGSTLYELFESKEEERHLSRKYSKPIKTHLRTLKERDFWKHQNKPYFSCKPVC